MSIVGNEVQATGHHVDPQRPWVQGVVATPALGWGGGMSGYGRPKLPRELERLFWRKVSVGLTTEDAAIAVGGGEVVQERWRIVHLELG